MAHYAFINSTNIVTDVITGKNEGEDGIDWEQWYGDFRGQTCKRTSVNTIGGVHASGGTPYRKNYARIGCTYDEERDAFYSPKPFPSWILNETSCLWEAPVARPPNGAMFMWNEEELKWDKFEQP